MLDSLLADLDVKKDVDYERLLKRLKRFDGIKPGRQPRTFQGELRPYQRHGLGWFRFLSVFGFGGCLADDMGLGKTIQVLALLEQRRQRRTRPERPKHPSLVVVPKTLIFNWLDEAERFTPGLKMLDYTGSHRQEKRRRFSEYHVVVTTYGILRRDVQYFRELKFDYVILDEAQAIKNPQSQAAKSCQLLNSENRLAMTGTPIENQLGDLWSIFEFLNPGMLGKLPAFQRLTGANKGREKDLALVRDAILPFILRRTKEEVLRDLPSKTEQILLIDLLPRQQKLYDELKKYYRSQLSDEVAKVGLKKSKMHILEALLRMRQLACDPRLLDPDSTVVGAKIEMLGEQLVHVVQDGHKALVFSQFTSLLALLREELTRQKITFEYLDGKTRDRGGCVKRFQNDDKIQVFLISLKAGGHGLNLTAADYVFILDPWWNPAVEAQAVDRAHRFGQTKPVVAYRMIARGTIEEKIMNLKNDKQRLAESIVTANSSVIKDLTAEDLAELFS
jgi:SNF2 family DNA or RNA helicase